MKITYYTTLLAISLFIAIPSNAQITGGKYRNLYKSMNKAHRNISVVKTNVADTDVILDTISVAELDSVMKNMVAVTDITKGGKSLLNPVVTLELDRESSASKALFGCDEYLERDPPVGKGIPEPTIPGIPKKTNKIVYDHSSAAALIGQGSFDKKDVEAALAPIETKSTKKKTVAKKEPEPVKKELTKEQENKATLEARKATGSRFLNEDWKLFRNTPVTFVNEKDRDLMKKYSIVIGSFNKQNNAEYAKRTFNGLGEQAVVVKNNQGIFYTILITSDNQTVATKKMEEFTSRYTANISKSRRIAKYGLPLDDLWILVYDK
ncbi:hypothetical protein [Dysgonomonas sp. 511]|uniref:hypothetical protein n=1 Tax=Dysgonomonas sp. 511 TaxID=2302930 RepID=UPI0013D0303E|nr:hypothetical protein [Dysgonomonas sp. 511]NDV78830.1 hypothetical protein [Dysgonomonas sp. 511]